jgi:hypothetical protein
VGVELALTGDTGKIIRQLTEQFGKLDKIIEKTNTSLNTLVSGMRTLRREAEGAARALGNAATAMERAARSSQRGGSAGGLAGAAATSAALRSAARPPGNGFSLLGPSYVPPGGAPPSRVPFGGLLANPYGQPPSSYLRLPPNQYQQYQNFTLGGQARPPGTSGALMALGGGAGGPGGPGTGFTLNGGPYVPGGPQGLTVPPYQPGAGGPIPIVNPFGPGGGGRGGGGWMQRAWNWRPPPSHGSLRTAGLEMGIPAWMGGEFLKNSFEAGADFQDWQKRLLAQGFDQEQVNRASSEAFRIQREVKPSTVSGNMKLLSEIMATVQNPKESLELLPEFARLQVELARAGNTHGAEDMNAAIKAAEFRGILQTTTDPTTGQSSINPDQLRAFMHRMLASTVITGGTIGPSQILQFYRSAGYAAGNLSDESAFAKNLALMQALGPGGAGTSLRGFEQQFTAGKMSDAAANLLMQMGILHGGADIKHNPYVTKSGIGHVFVDPRAYPKGMQMEASRDPDKFIVDYLFPKISQFLGKRLGDQYTKAPDADKRVMEMNYVGTIASTQTGAKELAEVFRTVSLIKRDAAAYQGALQRPIGETLTGNNPKIEAAGLGASWQAFLTSLGNAAMKPAVELLDALTKDLNMLTEWARKNPDGAEKALKGLAAGVGMFAAGSAAAVALTILTGPAGFVALAGGVAALGTAFTKLPPGLIGAMAGAAAGGRVAGLPGAVVGGAIGGAGAHMAFGPSQAEIDAAARDYDAKHPWSAAIDRFFGFGSPNAPVATTENRGARSTPVPVHITNPADLTHGVGQGLWHSSNKPQQGVTGFDTSTSDINGLYNGLAAGQ